MEPRYTRSPKGDDRKFKKPSGRPGAYGDKKEHGSAGSRMPRKRMRRVLPPLDYKDTEGLGKYLTEKGKILPRRITRLNAKDQRILTRLIKKARHAGLVPFQAN